MKDSIVAVVAVRAGSRRLKNKNILPFGESNLLVHKIRQLKQIEEITSIVVSSDSDEMLSIAKEEGVLTHKRAIEFCDEKSRPFNDVVENVASNIEGKHMLWAPCVCPLVKTGTIKDAIKIYLNNTANNSEYDSLVSVKMLKEYILDGNGPLNFSSKVHIPSQELPEWMVVVNGFFIINREYAIKKKYWYGDKPYRYILDKMESVDIDDKDDFEFAEFLYNKYYKG